MRAATRTKFAIDWRDRQSWKEFGTSSAGREFVYRLYDVDDRLIYVGITWNPFVRWTYHSRTKFWWPSVSAVSLEDVPDEEARAGERHAILTEYPRRNIHQVPRGGAI